MDDNEYRYVMSLKVVCAWCDKLLYNPPSACADEELGVTHTICSECRDRVLMEVPDAIKDHSPLVEGDSKDTWQGYDLGGEG